MKEKKGFFHFLLRVFSWLFLIFFVVILLLTMMSNFDFFGGYRSLIVQSGSMEPSIMTGDVIITSSQREYHRGDVITFSDNDGRTVTHRIVSIINNNGEERLITKGDANRVVDNAQIKSDQILGKVVLTVPRLGYLIAFGRSKWGLALLVLGPCFLIIFDFPLGVTR